MINKIKVITNGVSQEIELRNPHKSGFLITSIDGLDPVVSDVSINDYATSDGGFYSFARARTRDISINIRFLGDIEKTRHKCYEVFPIKSEIELVIYTTNRVLSTIGYVSKNEVNIFSDKEDTNIQIECPNSWLKAYVSGGYNVYSFSGTINKFEFPFSNEVGTNELEFSEILRNRYGIIEYDGDVSTGAITKIHAAGVVEGLKMANLSTNTLMELDDSIINDIVGSGITNGDEIVINSIVGQKSITLYRGVDEYNILQAMTPNSDWLTLNKGINELTYLADVGANNVLYSIHYNELYMGV